MRKIFKKIAIFLLAAIVIMPAAASDTYASSSVSITGGDDVKGGEIFEITVTFDGDSIGRVTGDITYDTEMISYISGGSSSGNVGYVELKNAGTGEPLTFVLEFQALKEGTTELKVSTSEMYDLDEEYMDTPSTSKTVTISGDAEEEEIVEETTVEDDASDSGLSVDEKDASENSSEAVTDAENEIHEPAADDESSFLARSIMFGIGILVLILIIVLILRRKK